MKEFNGLKIPEPKGADPRLKALYLQKSSCNMVQFSHGLGKVSDLPCYDIDCSDCLFCEKNLDDFVEWLEKEGS
jgi:hypothetical protein